jgi:hypothetical protein
MFARYQMPMSISRLIQRRDLIAIIIGLADEFRPSVPVQIDKIFKSARVDLEVPVHLRRHRTATGSVGSRALYAIGTAFVRKGDNGHWQPDYTDVLGGLAASEISMLYYPSSSRPVRRLVDNVLLGFGGRAARNLAHEFLFRQVTTHVLKIAAGLTPRILPEGTPVSLISVEDWSSKTGGPIAFILAGDIQVNGVTVAPIGAKAWGQASFGGDGKAIEVGLDHVRLKVGDTDVPLRSTPLRDGGGALEYHRLENSGRIAIVLYVAGNVTFSAAR